MNQMRRHSELLLNEVLLVSRELIRVAVTWAEAWHEGLEDAAEAFFGLKNIDRMVDILQPLHQELNRGPATLMEITFYQSFGADLKEAEVFTYYWKMVKD